MQIQFGYMCLSRPSEQPITSPQGSLPQAFNAAYRSENKRFNGNCALYLYPFRFGKYPKNRVAG